MKVYLWLNDPSFPEEHPPRYFVCASVSERPSSDLRPGDLAAVLDVGELFISDGERWIQVAPGKSGR